MKHSSAAARFFWRLSWILFGLFNLQARCILPRSSGQCPADQTPADLKLQTMALMGIGYRADRNAFIDLVKLFDRSPGRRKCSPSALVCLADLFQISCRSFADLLQITDVYQGIFWKRLNLACYTILNIHINCPVSCSRPTERLSVWLIVRRLSIDRNETSDRLMHAPLDTIAPVCQLDLFNEFSKLNIDFVSTL